MAKVAKKTVPGKHTTRKTVGKKVSSSKAPKASTKKPSSKSKAKKKKAHKKPVGTCFVLTPFKEPFDTYYTTIIKPAVIAARLEPLRGDSLFRPSPIMGDIWAMIQDARVLVAELTEKNANVFYELGLGHAIGKPIVLMSETMDDVPFDLQPLRVIIYDKDDPAWGIKLRNNLIASLVETISDSTNAVPPMFRKKVKSQAPEEAATSIRLSALEREVGALRSDELRGLGSLRAQPMMVSALGRFRHEIRGASNRDDAIAAVRRAIMRGVPEPAIRRAMKDYVAPSELEEIMAIVSRVPFIN